MGTTAVVAELFVGGVQALTWIGLIAATVFGPDVLWRLVKDPSAALGVLALVAAYSLGVVFDRLWDSAVNLLRGNERTRPRAGPKVTETDELRRAVYGVDTGHAAELVDYTRSRMRVARASLFNGVAITVSGVVLMVVHPGFFGPHAGSLTVAAAALGTLFCFACWFAHAKLIQTYDLALEVYGRPRISRPPS